MEQMDETAGPEVYPLGFIAAVRRNPLIWAACAALIISQAAAFFTL